MFSWLSSGVAHPNALIVSLLSVQDNSGARARPAGRRGRAGILGRASKAGCAKARYNQFMPGTLTPALPAPAVDSGAAPAIVHGRECRPGAATHVRYPVSRMWPGITEGIWDARCECTRAPLGGVYQVKRLSGACPVHFHLILPAGTGEGVDPQSRAAAVGAPVAPCGAAGSGRGTSQRAKQEAPRPSRTKAASATGPRPAGGVSAASSRPKRAHAAPSGNATEIEYCPACKYPVASRGHKVTCG
jgi:hypothetical protein